MFTVLILICAIHVTPPDYQIETASAVLQGPGPRKGRYLKIKCRRAPTERSEWLNSEIAS